MASQPLSIVDIYRAVEHAARSTEFQLDDHAIYSLDQAIKQKTLKIFVDPRVKALVTLTRRRDDTITLHLGNQRANGLSEPRSDGIISSHWARQPLEPQRLRLKELILKRLVKSHGQRTIDQSFLTNGYHILTGIILTDIDDRTEKILKNIYNHIQNGSGREETILSHATSKINKQIRTRIIRKDLVQIAVQLVVQPPSRTVLTTDLYNHVVLNQDALDYLLDNLPNVAKFHWHCIARPTGSTIPSGQNSPVDLRRPMATPGTHNQPVPLPRDNHRRSLLQTRIPTAQYARCLHLSRRTPTAVAHDRLGSLLPPLTPLAPTNQGKNQGPKKDYPGFP